MNAKDEGGYNTPLKETLIQEISLLVNRIEALNKERDAWLVESKPWHADDAKAEAAVEIEKLWDLLADALDTGLDTGDYPLIQTELTKYNVRKMLR